MKPIHKLNNGRGATLCNTCSVIITTGLTKDLYCEKCKPKQHICTCERPDYYCDCLLYDEKVKKEPKQELPIINGSYGCTIETKKQETLEEVAEKYVDSFEYSIAHPRRVAKNAFINGAKWQQERSYSEEEALNLLTHFAVEIQRQNKKGQYPIEIKGWFERNKETFKNK